VQQLENSRRWFRCLLSCAALSGIIALSTPVPALSECMYTPSNSFVQIGSRIFARSQNYGVSIEADRVEKNSKIEGVEGVARAKKRFEGTYRRASLFGVIDFPEFNSKVRFPKITDDSFEIYEYTRKIINKYTIVPKSFNEDELSNGKQNFQFKVFSVAQKHKCTSETSAICSAEIAANYGSRLRTSRILNNSLLTYPSESRQEIVHSKEGINFVFDTKVLNTKTIRISGCDIKISQVEIAENLAPARKETRYVLWGWLASSSTEADLKRASLVSREIYSESFIDLLK
jgi:hypothetical protein